MNSRILFKFKLFEMYDCHRHMPHALHACMRCIVCKQTIKSKCHRSIERSYNIMEQLDKQSRQTRTTQEVRDREGGRKRTEENEIINKIMVMQTAHLIPILSFVCSLQRRQHWHLCVCFISSRFNDISTHSVSLLLPLSLSLALAFNRWRNLDTIEKFVGTRLEQQQLF